MNSYQQGGSGVNEDTFARMDLSGKLIIKVQLGDDIRRIPIHNEDITYDELVLMMQRVFRGKLSNNDDVVIKYKDEDGDLITIFDSSDLQFAIQCSRILQLTLFVNGQPRPLQSNEARHIREELRFLRDKILSLMDHLEPAACRALDEPANPEADVNKEKQATTVTNTTSSKEFDPLTTVKNEDATPEEHRSGSPDSISSRSSSISHQKPQINQQPVNYGAPQLPGGNASQGRPGQPASPYLQYPQSGPQPPAAPASLSLGQSHPSAPKPGYGNPGAQQTYPGYQPPAYQPPGYQSPGYQPPGYSATPPNTQSLYGQQQQPPQQSSHLPPTSGNASQYPPQASPVMGMQAPPQGTPQMQPGQVGNPYARVNPTAFQRPPAGSYPTNY
ncbi:hypothetical protein CHUAL_011428 [Chamberlinius hualienensis]